MIVHVRDGFNLLSKLTLRRAINILKVGFGFFISRITSKPVVYGIPVSVSIEPTTSCNLRCPECTSGLRAFTRPTGMMTFSLLNSIVEQLHRDILYMIFYFQGEPFLNKDVFEMIEN